MAGEWRSERFARIAVLVRDTVRPSDAPRLPYIGLEHIGEGTLRLVGTGIAEDATSLKARFSAGDILFGKLRPYFRKVIRAPFDGICSTDIWVVRPQPGVDAGFLFYLMASHLFLEPVVRASEGTKMPRAKWEYAASLELPLPPLPEQRAIAHILGTLDDKIELNRRMSETLEAMARALFKAWFVDFEPVRAKYRGESATRPYKPLHSGQFAAWLD
jgi:type I restriction enzyme S subunit